MPIGPFPAVALVLAGLPLQIFSPHMTFSNRDVPQQIAECEFPRRVAPVQLVGRNATGHPHGAFADIPEIVKKRFDSLNFHEGLALASVLENNLRKSLVLFACNESFSQLSKFTKRCHPEGRAVCAPKYLNL